MDIKKDLPQTFPLSLRNSMRQSQEPSTDGDPFGGLRRVLQAYSLCNPASDDTDTACNFHLDLDQSGNVYGAPQTPAAPVHP
ncbi:hypothetical protein PF010_g29102 [Phytophthora fragariae]|uniref:Uncharacterized protein n=1 Tax=Phytophthora fragariae TaxID=53985 RepID=A0A6G0JP78_9STRA|nr:hypothetical protein PF010_g29102 [Phytophthora fragariae]